MQAQPDNARGFCRSTTHIGAFSRTGDPPLFGHEVAQRRQRDLPRVAEPRRTTVRYARAHVCDLPKCPRPQLGFWPYSWTGLLRTSGVVRSPSLSKRFGTRQKRSAVIRAASVACASVVLTGCGGQSNHGPPSCNTFTSPAKTGTCVDTLTGARSVFANRDQVLELDTLTEKVQRINVVIKLASGPPAPHGQRFVVISVTVRNLTGVPLSFHGDYPSPELDISHGAHTYDLISGDRHSCVFKSNIAAHGQTSCDLEFGQEQSDSGRAVSSAVPIAQAQAVRSSGTLFLDPLHGRPQGVIRLYA